MSQETPVLFEEIPVAQGNKALGIVTLNAEKSLNSLGFEMLSALHDRLSQWKNDRRIVAVWLQGAGERAFCAGANIVRLYQALAEQREQLAADVPEPFPVCDFARVFFTLEYSVIHLLRSFSKPVIAWGHGIVMGGGLGVMNAARFRIVTEKTRLAMPEVAIGLYPDAGAGWFLSRMPGKAGAFLGMTGTSINSRDALFVGLADHFIESRHKASLLAELTRLAWSDSDHSDSDKSNSDKSNSDSLRSLLEQYAQASQPQLPAAQIEPNLPLINELLSPTQVGAAVASLVEASLDDEWMTASVQGLKRGCPMSIALAWEHLSRSRGLTVTEVLRNELVLSVNCCRRRDLQEGIRSRLIEKDNQPAWRHLSAAAVTHREVDEHFVLPPDVALSFPLLVDAR
ncbi:hypothetical protein C4K68_19195 [Pokkaliibacter plantistimulans]|uniref:3-hydroxyisobutyryl-CoA hydrolase n=1 Tax=Proteobacteria bacterium 228 TaxID=2083153 RepID=A0A2S5KLT5_9PROT|nr:enoyl-CoA hydratase/isomerase family protein [Pokkaliibacter plantistimulans]PPC75700.1 hypothetical protein C4K68_19195 [Pokkaliibacter plantistimulans]